MSEPLFGIGEVVIVRYIDLSSHIGTVRRVGQGWALGPSALTDSTGRLMSYVTHIERVLDPLPPGWREPVWPEEEDPCAWIGLGGFDG